MSGTKKVRKWLLGGSKERIRQFYFVDSDGKQHKCKRNLVSVVVRRIIKPVLRFFSSCN